MGKMKGQRVWLKSDVMDYLWLQATEDDEDVNSILRRLFNLPEPDSKTIFVEGTDSRRKYDVSDLAVGEHKIFQLEFGADGKPIKTRSIVQSVRNYMKKEGKLFHTSITADGFMVYRAR